jgi:peptide-methionine (S)-S-oxide reductase
MRRTSMVLLALALAPLSAAAETKTETAIFAGGCFWSMEHDMESIPGVTGIVVGYTGGTLDNPTYKDVLTEKTGHYEAVKVTFDPSKISYAQLVERYWHVVDPVDAGGAYCDRGASYRSAIFAMSADQKKIAEASRSRLQPPSGATVATVVKDAMTFYPAEEYHQHYATKNPDHYNKYRAGCGKDARIKQLWGERAFK